MPNLTSSQKKAFFVQHFAGRSGDKRKNTTSKSTKRNTDQRKRKKNWKLLWRPNAKKFNKYSPKCARNSAADSRFDGNCFGKWPFLLKHLTHADYFIIIIYQLVKRFLWTPLCVIAIERQINGMLEPPHTNCRRISLCPFIIFVAFPAPLPRSIPLTNRSALSLYVRHVYASVFAIRIILDVAGVGVRFYNANEMRRFLSRDIYVWSVGDWPKWQHTDADRVASSVVAEAFADFKFEHQVWLIECSSLDKCVNFYSKQKHEYDARFTPTDWIANRVRFTIQSIFSSGFP